MTILVSELTVGGNEASELLPVRDPALLARHGWRHAFWTVLDEGPVEASIALLGVDHSGQWSTHHVAVDVGDQVGRTEDAEALAWRDGWVYVLGSHFGSKGGPLKPRRAFAARFREADAALDAPVPVRVARIEFRLHRAVNDALTAGVVPLAPGPTVRERFMSETLRRGTRKARAWLTHLREDDAPVNVEAAAFGPTGTLLLGLRYPVSVDGQPLLVEVSDVDSLFDLEPATLPSIGTVYVLAGATPIGTLTGFRALSPRADGSYDAVVGSIDALGKGSVLLTDHPEGGDVTCRHVRFRLPDSGSRIAADVVAELPFHHVEGVATVDGATWFVTDEDHRIAVWCSR